MTHTHKSLIFLLAFDVNGRFFFPSRYGEGFFVNGVERSVP